MTITSLSARPERTTRNPSWSGPSSITRGATLPSSFTVIAIFCDWSLTTAASGMRTALCGSEAGTRTRPNCPAVMISPGLGKIARARIVPDPASSWLSVKSRWPSCGQPFSSVSRRETATELSRVDFSNPLATSRW